MMFTSIVLEYDCRRMVSTTTQWDNMVEIYVIRNGDEFMNILRCCFLLVNLQRQIAFVFKKKNCHLIRLPTRGNNVAM